MLFSNIDFNFAHFSHFNFAHFETARRFGLICVKLQHGQFHLQVSNCGI